MKKELQCPRQLRGVLECLLDMPNVEQPGGRMKTSTISFLPLGVVALLYTSW